MFIIYIDSIQCVHHSVNEEKVLKYKKEIEEGANFPPVEVVVKDGAFLVLDGAHRVEAHQRLNEPILAMVYDWDNCPKKFLIGRRVTLVSV